MNRPRIPATILAVEDSAEILELMEMALSSSGDTIICSSTAEEALRLWEQHGRSIDLMITDVRLGGSLSGLELAERLVGRRPSLRILAISGLFEAEQLSRLRGEVVLLRKPFSVSELRRSVELLLARDRTGCGADRLGLTGR